MAISHLAPFRCTRPTTAANRLLDEEILDAAYRSDLTSLIVPAPDDGSGALQPPDVWVFDHTHERVDTIVGETHLVSNAKGYGPLYVGQPWSNPGFDPNFVIEI